MFHAEPDELLRVWVQQALKAIGVPSMLETGAKKKPELVAGT